MQVPNVTTGHFDRYEIDTEVATALTNAAAVLEKRGAIIVEVSLPLTRHVIPTFIAVSRIEAASNLSRYAGVHYGYRSSTGASDSNLDEMYRHTRGEGFGFSVLERILAGIYASSALYWQSSLTGRPPLSSDSSIDRQNYIYQLGSYARARIRQEYENVFEKVQCLLTPTTPAAACPLQRSRIHHPESTQQFESVFSTEIASEYSDCFTAAANLTGLPAISIPCGTTEHGLPIGAQLIANEWQETVLVKVAHAFERETEWHLRRPQERHQHDT